MTLPKEAENVDMNLEKDEMRSSTCIEFLQLMKEFTESSCNTKEMLQRVDNLVHQDENLLKLLPLARNEGNPEDSENKVPNEEIQTSSDMEIEVILGTHSEPDKTKSGTTMMKENATDELHRWIDLDLDLDSEMDVFDFPMNLSNETSSVILPTSTCGSTTTTMIAPTTSPFTKQSSNVFLGSSSNSSSSASGSGSNNSGGSSSNNSGSSSSSSNSTSTPTSNSCIVQRRLTSEKKTTAPFRSTTKVNMTHAAMIAASAAARNSSSNSSSSSTSTTSTSTHSYRKTSMKLMMMEPQDEEMAVWGMQEDEYEQDLLASIDHAVLCDRENRFIQWADLENNPNSTKLKQGSWSMDKDKNHLTSKAKSLYSTSKTMTPPTSISSSSTTSGSSTSSHQSTPMGMSKSPSHVDMIEDWNLLDFGTVQNRTVSHILSSCLQKRKLHHPYKNQVKLVNFNVPKHLSSSASGASSSVGSGSSSSSSSSCSSSSSSSVGSSQGVGNGGVGAARNHHLGGSLATSLAFGSDFDPIAVALDATSGDLEALKDGLLSNAFGATSILSVVPTSTSPTLKGNKNDGQAAAVAAAKKSKKKEEKKRLLAQKMEETLAELENTFTEEDLDVKNLDLTGADLLSVLGGGAGGTGGAGGAGGAGAKGKGKGKAKTSSTAFTSTGVGTTGSNAASSSSSSSTGSTGTTTTSTSSKYSKLDNMPLPDLTNLPQDLRELKRKIEITEHKVEGTKHRHRKGGPCPRCQVQNQLRAAKRAYHKRAIAHKKLPQNAASVTASSNPLIEAAKGSAVAGATTTTSGLSELTTSIGAITKPVASVTASRIVNSVTTSRPGVTSAASSVVTAAANNLRANGLNKSSVTSTSTTTSTMARTTSVGTQKLMNPFMSQMSGASLLSTANSNSAGLLQQQPPTSLSKPSMSQPQRLTGSSVALATSSMTSSTSILAAATAKTSTTTSVTTATTQVKASSSPTGTSSVIRATTSCGKTVAGTTVIPGVSKNPSDIGASTSSSTAGASSDNTTSTTSPNTTATQVQHLTVMTA